MSFADAFRLALGSLTAHRRRTLLSLLGMAIGVASVLLLTGLGSGAVTYVEEQFLSIGSNVVAVLPGKVETTGGIPGYGGVPNDLTLQDAEAVRRRIPGVERVAPLVIANDTVAHGGYARQVLVLGATAELAPLRDLTMRGGSFLPEGPWERGSAVVVMGDRVARELFPGTNPLGAFVHVGGWRMRVVGLIGSQGVHFGVNLDDAVFVPVSTAMRMFDVSSLSRLALQMRSGWSLADAERSVRAVLLERHGEEDFTVTTPDAVAASLTAILAVLTLALAGIAGISLGVAGIGTMNVMLVAVSERTAEIGLLKAIGATGRQVLSVFLAEAVLLSGAGGLLGVAIGWGAVALAARLFPALPARVVPWAAVAGFAAACVVGAVFGFLPARRAVRMDPVEALSRRMR